MAHHARSLEPLRGVAAIALGLTAVFAALAISGGPGPSADAPLGNAPAPSASPLVPSTRSVSAARDDLRSGPVSAPPGPTRTSDSVVAHDLGTTPDPGSAREASASAPPPAPEPFTIDLFDAEDFVSQGRVDWCVPASILTMMNMIDVAEDPATPTQHELDLLARSLSTPRLRGAGSEPEGWAGSLNRLGYGPYEVRTEPTRDAAIAAAARALRMTGRPVGLLVWRGAHAWVVSGFRATADPAYTDGFTVTHLHVVDPWYPRVSSIWGPSRPPDSLVQMRLVVDDYLAWRRPAVRYPEKDGGFVLVVPAAESPAVPTGPNPRAR